MHLTTNDLHVHIAAVFFLSQIKELSFTYISYTNPIFYLSDMFLILLIINNCSY